MKRIEPTDEWFQGAISLEKHAEGIRPWRIPHQQRGLYVHEDMLTAARRCSGVRLRFRSATTRIRLDFAPLEEEIALDCVIDGELRTARSLPGEGVVQVEGLAAAPKTVELWLDPRRELTLAGMWIDDDAEISAAEDTRPRWITYGSSITACGAAGSPARTWPAVVARRSGLHLQSLGFGGQCHLDPLVAQMMRDLPADVISLCLGINIYGRASLGPRAFISAAIGFVKLLREKHPTVPIAVISPIYGAHREHEQNAVGFTLPLMRRELEKAVGLLAEYGDPSIHYVNGLELLGEAEAHLLPDHLHPDAEGYELMGERFHRQVMSKLLS